MGYGLIVFTSLITVGDVPKPRIPCDSGVELEGNMAYSVVHEADIPAKEAQTSSHPRLFVAYRDHERQAGTHAQAPKGPREAYGVAMPRRNRLSRRVFPSRTARRIVGSLVSISITPLNGSIEPRFTCVVSKKTATHAADRNRLKRRCREVMRPFVASLPPLAFVIYPKRTALDVPFEALVKEVRSLLGQIIG